jgi:hypothetical protein
MQQWIAMRNFPGADYLDAGDTTVDYVDVEIDPAHAKELISFRLAFVPCKVDAEQIDFHNHCVYVDEGNAPPAVSTLMGTYWSGTVTVSPSLVDPPSPTRFLTAELERIESLHRQHQKDYRKTHQKKTD